MDGESGTQQGLNSTKSLGGQPAFVTEALCFPRPSPDHSQMHQHGVTGSTSKPSGDGFLKTRPFQSIDIKIIFITNNHVTVGKSINRKVDLSASSRELSFKTLSRLLILSFRFLICKTWIVTVYLGGLLWRRKVRKRKKYFTRVACVQRLIHFAISYLSYSCGFKTLQRSQPWYLALF